MRETLKPGTVVGRYGPPSGKFASPAGTPFNARGLPAESSGLPLQSYEIQKPLGTWGGTVRPWFDQPGGGTQYEFDKSIQSLVDEGYLRELK